MNSSIKESTLVVLITGVFSFVLLCPFTLRPEGKTETRESGPVEGKRIFETRCAMCHGMTGDGNGVAAAFVDPRPRNFKDGKFKFRSTETGSIPTDEDLERTVREGLHSTSMPDWKDFIGGDSLKAVVSYVKSLSPRFQSEQPKVVRVSSAIASSPSVIEAGKKVYAKLQCESCHGSDGAGSDAVARDLKDDWGYDVPATNLTEPWTFRRGSSAQDIYLRVRTGIDGSPMPSYAGSASEKELWNLASYVISLGRKPIWTMNALEIQQHYAKLQHEAERDKIAHGRYLVKMRGCESCHSTYDAGGLIVEGMQLAGGLKWSLGPYGNVTSRNLTSDKETGLGGWSDEEIKRGITKGIRKDGSRSIPFPMPWTSYSNLSEGDLNAITAYLRTVPPVVNKIPDPEPKDIFSYLWGKFKMVILHEDFASFTYPGNAGMRKEARQ